MEFKEIVEKLEELKISPKSFVTFDEYEDKPREISKILQDNFGVIENVKYETCGDGNDAYCIKHLVDHDVYIKIDFCYSSHDEDYYEESQYLEVYPTEVSIPVFKRVNGEETFNIIHILL